MDRGITQQIGIFLLHVILITLTATSFSVTAFAFHARISRKYIALLFPLCLTVSELIRSLLISTLYTGNGGHFGIHFTASTTGDALSTTPFVEFAYFGGTFALTFTLALLIILYYAPLRRTKKLAGYTTLTVLWLGVHLLPVTHPTTPLTITSIATDFGPPDREGDTTTTRIENFSVVDTLVKSKARYNPDIIVLPEETQYRNNFTKNTKIELLTLFRDTLFVDGTTVTQAGKHSNVSLFYNLNTPNITSRTKIFMFPFSEYIPTFFVPIFSHFAGASYNNTYIQERSYASGTSTSVVTHNGNIIATLLCSEVLSFATIQKTKALHPTVVLFQSELSVFHNNPLAFAIARMALKTAAAQMRTTIITATNNGENYSVSPYGVLAHLRPHSFSASTYSISQEGVGLAPAK
jgi:apolipoprotein N-acyltransferase